MGPREVSSDSLAQSPSNRPEIAMDTIFSAQDKFKQDLGLSKVKVVHNQNYKRHGTKSYVSALHRYKFKTTKPGPYFHVDKVTQHGILPEQLKAAVGGIVRTERILVKKVDSGDGGDGHTGEVTAEDQQNDSMYICEIGIGEPVQKLLVDFDTGSADTWVRTKEDKGAHEGHNVFDPKKSKTFKKLSGMKWQIQYGDGSTASGNCGSDTLVVGGLSIKNQTIECATKLSREFSQGTSDGLLGLAWGKINTVTDAGEADPQSTPVENMIKQDDIPKSSELFTSAFYSSRDKGAESFYTFGYIDQGLIKKSGQSIHWTEVDNSQGFWSVLSESCTIDGESIDLSGNTAIADTGTTLALMSDKVVEKVYEKIPGATYDFLNQGFIFPITVKADDIPEIKVAVGDKEYLIQKEDLAFALTDDKQHWYGGIQSRGFMPFDILGDTFLKSVYSIWDQGNRRLGLVPKIQATQSLDPPPDDGGADGGEKERITSLDLVTNQKYLV
ncbi:acid protease [Hypoxylon sp. NC0597]|nr:acid protease [Hypoxylon sp. NC0597]